jgi:hypothetical protein
VAKKEAASDQKTGTTAMARLSVPSKNRGTQRHGWDARASAVAGARGCARALELARRVFGFGFGRTTTRWRDAVRCAGDDRRLDRGGETGNEHEKRWRGEAGANHDTLVSSRKGPTLASHGECA